MDYGIIILLSLLLGISLLFYWFGLYLYGKRKLKFSIRDLEPGESFIVFHIIIEVTTGLLLILSAILLFIEETKIGVPLALFSSGMLLYASFNAMGWSLRNEKPLTLILAISGLIAILNLVLLI